MRFLILRRNASWPIASYFGETEASSMQEALQKLLSCRSFEVNDGFHAQIECPLDYASPYVVTIKPLSYPTPEGVYRREGAVFVIAAEV